MKTIAYAILQEAQKLKVSLKYLYSDYFTVEEEKIIESDMSEEDISKEIL